MAFIPQAYIAIDLKSFYASAECADRGFDPLTTNLVVADPSRTEKTICLAVSPSLKAHGISGRARLFEVVQKVKEVNAERLRKAIHLGLVKKSPDDRKYHFSGSSFSAPALAADPSLELTYYVAPPRMKLYEEISTRIVSIYMKYISPDDLIVYSIPIMQTARMRHRPGKPGLTAAAIFNTIIFMNGNAFPAGDREDRKAGVGPT